MSYFGPADQARQYFIDMGYQPANRQTTADFLVGVTHVPSRMPRIGYEARVPRTPAEFADHFAKSVLGKANAEAVRSQLYDTTFKDQISTYKASARADHANHVPPGSPYIISLAMQVRILMRRRAQIIRGDMAPHGWLILLFSHLFMVTDLRTSYHALHLRCAEPNDRVCIFQYVNYYCRVLFSRRYIIFCCPLWRALLYGGNTSLICSAAHRYTTPQSRAVSSLHRRSCAYYCGCC